MAKHRPPDKGDTTDFSFADRYLEDRRFPKYVPIRAKFPLVDDRKAANIDYTDDVMKRMIRNVIPGESVDYDNLSIIKPRTFDSGKYLFINNAPHTSHVPQGYYGTESGIFPIDFIPFTQGPASDNPTTITELDDSGSNVSGVEFLVAENTETNNMRGEEGKYYPYDSASFSGNVGRFEWNINPEFDNPTEPNVRFPRGATRKRTFKY